MNRKHFVSLFAAAILAVVPSFSAISSTTVHATVPFAFQAGKATLPAGTYRISSTSYNGIIALQNEEGKKAMIMTTIAAGPRDAKPGRLVFQRNGAQFTLAQVWFDAGQYLQVTPLTGTPVEVQFSR